LPEAENGPAVTLAEIRSKAEKDAIEHALQRHGYKLSEAAAELGISRATLYRLMHANRLHQDVAAGRASNAGGGADADGEAERRAPSLV
jgi:DNA-binding NtrC family response regulator